MASQTLRAHRSPSPSPSPSQISTPINPANPAKLTRQSLGPPSTSQSGTGSAKGFTGLGISSPTPSGGFGIHPRHVSSSVALGGGRETLSPRPSYGTGGGRAVSGGFGQFGLSGAGGLGARPSSEFLPSRAEAKTPEAEQIDQWFQHLASWENTLEEMAAASTDQNFTEELGAIEQWFRVLSEAERTAALYSLLQHSTPVQIKFLMQVLHHMSQSDPMSAIMSPNPSNLKSPSAGGGSGFPGSPTVNQFLAPETALEQKNRARQNRISAPGTLQPSMDRWTSGLEGVAERSGSPGGDSFGSRSKSPGLEALGRPKSTDFSGKSPRVSSGAAPVGLGIGAEVTSPLLNNASWASMVNTPLVPMFTDPNIDGVNAALSLANIQLAATQDRIALEDARQFRRPGAGTARNVSGQYNDDGEIISQQIGQPGRNAGSPLTQNWARSPVLDTYGLGLGGGDGLAGLGMGFANMGIGAHPQVQAQAVQAQLLALAQAQQMGTAASFAQSGYGGGARNDRGPARPPVGGVGRRSPMLGGTGAKHSPNPGTTTGGGGAGSGAGVAGVDDVDMRVLEDVAGWLRVLRLHKYTTTFEKSNWRAMVALNDQDLQNKGVSAQGARTKFLKVFYNVREKEGIPHPPGQEEYAPTGKD